MVPEKTTETNKKLNEHNIVRNLNWPKANQLVIYKGGRGFELKQIQLVAERDSNTGRLDCESDALATRPRCLLHSIPRNNRLYSHS